MLSSSKIIDFFCGGGEMNNILLRTRSQIYLYLLPFPNKIIDCGIHGLI